jgi:hypothetical protein
MSHTREHGGSGIVSLHSYRVNLTLREAIKPKITIAEVKMTHFHRHNFEISHFYVTTKSLGVIQEGGKKEKREREKYIIGRTDELAFLERYCTQHYCNNTCTWRRWPGISSGTLLLLRYNLDTNLAVLWH